MPLRNPFKKPKPGETFKRTLNKNKISRTGPEFLKKEVTITSKSSPFPVGTKLVSGGKQITPNKLQQEITRIKQKEKSRQELTKKEEDILRHRRKYSFLKSRSVLKGEKQIKIILPKLLKLSERKLSSFKYISKDIIYDYGSNFSVGLAILAEYRTFLRSKTNTKNELAKKVTLTKEDATKILQKVDDYLKSVYNKKPR